MPKRKLRNKTVSLLVSAIFLLVGIIVQQLSPVPSQTLPPAQGKTPSQPITPRPYQESIATVSGVIDGDTIILEDGNHVRYIGIDTPELKTHGCFSEEAKQKNIELVLGKQVKLVKDVSETDKYKRLLRYIYLLDGSFVNNILVEEGYAYASSYPPDIAMQEVFRASQQSAKINNRGLWIGCRPK